MGNNQGVATLKPPKVSKPSGESKEWSNRWNELDLDIDDYDDDDWGNASFYLMEILERLIQVFDQNPPPEEAISLSQVKKMLQDHSHLKGKMDQPHFDISTKSAFDALNKYYGPGTIDAFNNTGLKVTQLRLSPKKLRSP